MKEAWQPEDLRKLCQCDANINGRFRAETRPPGALGADLRAVESALGLEVSGFRLTYSS